MTPKRYSGSVVKRPFGVGSKSEHEAIFLATKEGDYVLRRQGGNAFFDPELEKLVGKKIQITLAVPRLDVSQSVPFVWKWPQRS